MVRTQKGRYNRNRVQKGQGLGDVLIKLAKTLGPAALKALESSVGPIAESVGKKIGRLIEGNGMVTDQGLGASRPIVFGKGSRLAGGSSK